jgi:hypothetical protein
VPLFNKDKSKIKSDAYPPAGLEKEQIDDKTDTATVGPLPGWCAISVNEIYGRSQRYRYFLNFEPVAMAGYSIYIYHITLNDANRVRRELGMSELEPENGEQSIRSKKVFWRTRMSSVSLWDKAHNRLFRSPGDTDNAMRDLTSEAQHIAQTTCPAWKRWAIAAASAAVVFLTCVFLKRRAKKRCSRLDVPCVYGSEAEIACRSGRRLLLAGLVQGFHSSDAADFSFSPKEWQAVCASRGAAIGYVVAKKAACFARAKTCGDVQNHHRNRR